MEVVALDTVDKAFDRGVACVDAEILHGYDMDQPLVWDLLDWYKNARRGKHTVSVEDLRSIQLKYVQVYVII